MESPFIKAVLHIPDWLLIIGAVLVFIVNMIVAVRCRAMITTRYHRILIAIAYGQLAAFYTIIHFNEGAPIPINVAIGLSRFIWLWFIVVGGIVAWQLLKNSKGGPPC